MWNCESCENVLVLDDFFKSRLKNCIHKNLKKFKGKYVCNQCGYESINGERNWIIKNCCKICDGYDNKIKNKKTPELLTKFGTIYFYVDSLECFGHWFEQACCLNSICLDCNLQDNSYNTLRHCCCKDQTKHELKLKIRCINGSCPNRCFDE